MNSPADGRRRRSRPPQAAFIIRVARFGRYLASQPPRRSARIVWYGVLRMPALRRTSVVTIDGLKLEAPTNGEVWRRIMTTGGYEGDVRRALQSLLKPTDVCVDVGANIGVHSIAMARNVPEGHVHAIEPVPAARALLQTNIARNAIPNVTVHPVAIANTAGHAIFNVTKDSVYSSLSATGRDRVVEQHEVAVETLDRLFPGGIDVLKIDIEGGELDCLHGATRLLGGRRRPRIIVCELSSQNHDAIGSDPRGPLNLLQDYGYTPYRCVDGSMLRGWRGDQDGEEVIFLDRTCEV